MSKRKVVSLIAISILFARTEVSDAGTIVVDDFSDGDDSGWTHVADPANRPWGPGIFDANSGEYRLATTGTVGGGFMAGVVRSKWDRSSEPIFKDGLWRTKLRIENAGTEAGIDVRFDTDSLSGYVFGIEAPSKGGGIAFLRADNGVPRVTRRISVPGTPIQVGQEWFIEAGAVGDTVTLKAWQTSDPEPESPHFTFKDATYDSGTFSVGASGHQGWRTDASFDDIFFTGPADFQHGDLDGNGVLDATDIDLLSANVRNADSSNVAVFDLNEDGRLDSTDHNFWIKDLKNTWYGDANLDGQFDSGDLIAVFQAGKYELHENAGWAEGDWTGDHRFDSGDLIAAFQDGGYEAGERTTINVVPEPGTLVLVSIALLGLCQLRKGRRMSRSSE